MLDISEIWRIAEEWWRDHPIQRTYYRLVLEDGRPLTIFHDETPPPSEVTATEDRFSRDTEGSKTFEDASTTCAGWFEQRY